MDFSGSIYQYMRFFGGEKIGSHDKNTRRGNSLEFVNFHHSNNNNEEHHTMRSLSINLHNTQRMQRKYL